jgi:hypothetical protein
MPTHTSWRSRTSDVRAGLVALNLSTWAYTVASLAHSLT